MWSRWRRKRWRNNDPGNQLQKVMDLLVQQKYRVKKLADLRDVKCQMFFC